MLCGGEKLIPILAKKGVTFKQLLYADHKTLSQVTAHFCRIAIFVLLIELNFCK
jgi:hypothetical protein